MASSGSVGFRRTLEVSVGLSSVGLETLRTLLGEVTQGSHQEAHQATTKLFQETAHERPRSGPPNAPTKGPINEPADEPTKGPINESTKGPTNEPSKGPTSDPLTSPLTSPLRGPLASPPTSPREILSGTSHSTVALDFKPNRHGHEPCDSRWWGASGALVGSALGSAAGSAVRTPTAL